MRHGERQDSADAQWVHSAARPWDPPLSRFGHDQATRRGAAFREQRTVPHLVVSSPFTRCLQTSCRVMRAAGLPPSALHVDARLCEWLSLRNLNVTAAAALVDLSRDLPEWFWGENQGAEAGIRAAIADAWSDAAAAEATIGHLKFPRAGERQAAARARFTAAIEHLVHSHACGAVLCVTHGDAVGAIVEFALPQATVYQVETTGFVTLHKASATDGLSLTTGTGVSWIG